jgi:hypothetical protein
MDTMVCTILGLVVLLGQEARPDPIIFPVAPYARQEKIQYGQSPRLSEGSREKVVRP